MEMKCQQQVPLPKTAAEVPGPVPGAPLSKESNWLPAPKGPFKLVMRLYGPKAEALKGKGKQPPLQAVK